MDISIVLSTYNGQQYILEQLQSLLAQIRQPDEVLIFDDCSTDDTVQLICNFIKDNSLSNWTLIQNVRNKGWKQNFKDGIFASKGDIIFPCDQDDIWFPSKLSDMERVMAEHPEINVLVSQYIELYEDGKENNLFEKNDGICTRADWHQRLFNVLYPGCTFCIRKSFLPDIENYWETYAHDAFLWRFAMLSGTAYIIRKPLIRWRKHIDSTFQIDNRKERNYQGKLDWLEYADGFIDKMTDYLNNATTLPKEEQIDGLMRYKHWIKLRRQFFQSRNPIYGIRLIQYMNCYSRRKQYLGDWVITYIWRNR